MGTGDAVFSRGLLEFFLLTETLADDGNTMRPARHGGCRAGRWAETLCSSLTLGVRA